MNTEGKLYFSPAATQLFQYYRWMVHIFTANWNILLITCWKSRVCASPVWTLVVFLWPHLPVHHRYRVVFTCAGLKEAPWCLVHWPRCTFLIFQNLGLFSRRYIFSLCDIWSQNELTRFKEPLFLLGLVFSSGTWWTSHQRGEHQHPHDAESLCFRAGRLFPLLPWPFMLPSGIHSLVSI